MSSKSGLEGPGEKDELKGNNETVPPGVSCVANERAAKLFDLGSFFRCRPATMPLEAIAAGIFFLANSDAVKRALRLRPGGILFRAQRPGSRGAGSSLPQEWDGTVPRRLGGVYPSGEFPVLVSCA